MNCNVVQDLMTLYSDNCCCEESKMIVEEHIKDCDKCKKVFEEMNAPIITEKESKVSTAKFTHINSWKASIMQSVLLFLSFVLLIFGVAREAATPTGDSNGLWAVAVIIPTTGFLLSLANWYFIRVYSSRKAFSNCSLLATFGFIIIGYIWAAFHYQNALTNLFSGSVLSTSLFIVGCVLSIIFCVLSKLFSNKFAQMTGKE